MKKNYPLVILILLVFFVISFLTNILGPIIPDIIDSFSLSLTLVSFLPFSFFIAYGFFSIPSGVSVEKYREKAVILFAFFISFIGALTFALFPSYGVAIASLFVIGSGMAILQVALNPLMRVVGGEENFAFNMVMIQLVFGAASYISPRVYSYLVANVNSGLDGENALIKLLSQLVPEGLAWVSIYWIFAIISLTMFFVMLLIRFPAVELKEDERVGAWNINHELLKRPAVILFFVGIFFYVGSEQGVVNWISTFLSTYHHIDPQTTGARTVSWFWGFFTAGTLLGMLLLKIVDSRKVLILFSISAMVSLTAALFGPVNVSLIAFPVVGFFASSMWSIIFSLALNSVRSHHGALSGILCSGVVGGAVVPVIVGGLGDLFGLRTGMMFLYLTFGYILSIGFWANPIVTNKTVAFRSLFRKHGDQ